MASNLQQTLYDLFAGIAPGAVTDPGGILGNVLQPGGTVAQGATKSGGEIASIAATVLKSGLGMMPLVNGILHLFGGGDTPAPPPLVKYALPPTLDILAGAAPGGLDQADTDQFGLPRVYGSDLAAPQLASASPAASSVAAAPQINVNVQAMDARSFLDRSTDIAAAVREAILHMSSINDVISEL